MPTGPHGRQAGGAGHVGILTKLPNPPAAAAKFQELDEKQDAALQARAYLDANCASCHSPGARFYMGFDFSFSATLEQMNICNAQPTHGDLGVAGAALLTPGEPGLSVISLRMRALDQNRMPRYGSSVVDTQATATVDRWISKLKDCNEP